MHRSADPHSGRWPGGRRGSHVRLSAASCDHRHRHGATQRASGIRADLILPLTRVLTAQHIPSALCIACVCGQCALIVIAPVSEQWWSCFWPGRHSKRPASRCHVSSCTASTLKHCCAAAGSADLCGVVTCSCHCNISGNALADRPVG